MVTGLDVKLIHPNHREDVVRLLQEAIAHYQAEDWQAAIDVSTQAARLDQLNPIAHNMIVVATSERGGLDEVVGEYQRAIELDYRSAVYHHALALALHRMGKITEDMADEDRLALWKQAEPEYKLSLRIARSNPVALNDLGLLYNLMGEPDKAEKKFRQGMKTDPKYKRSYFNLGQMMRRRGQFMNAAVTLEQGLVVGEGDLREYQDVNAQIKEELKKCAKAFHRTYYPHSR
jgi:tetratricopeptide (TPR) repeat protein